MTSIPPLPLSFAERIERYVSETLENLTDTHHMIGKVRPETRYIAEQLTRRVTSGPGFINGRDPRIVAGAIVYLVCRITSEKIRQVDVALALEVTDAAIRTNYQALLDYLIEHKEEYKDVIPVESLRIILKEISSRRNNR